MNEWLEYDFSEFVQLSEVAYLGMKVHVNLLPHIYYTIDYTSGWLAGPRRIK